jgi:hypothetical protein
MSPSRSAEIPDSPVSLTSPSSLPTGPALFLSPPTGEPISSLPFPSSPTSSPDPSSPQDSSDAAGSWSSGYEGSESSEPYDESSDTPSTAGKQNPVTAAGLRRVVEQGVLTVTSALASIAANADEQEHGLWRADADDVEGISRPAARLVYRRLPGEAKNSDAVDIFGLALAVGVYVVKNLKLRAAVRARQLVTANEGEHQAAEQFGATEGVPTFPGGGF